jgi:hypothetical protein
MATTAGGAEKDSTRNTDESDRSNDRTEYFRGKSRRIQSKCCLFNQSVQVKNVSFVWILAGNDHESRTFHFEPGEVRAERANVRGARMGIAQGPTYILTDQTEPIVVCRFSIGPREEILQPRNKFRKSLDYRTTAPSTTRRHSNPHRHYFCHYYYFVIPQIFNIKFILNTCSYCSY